MASSLPGPGTPSPGTPLTALLGLSPSRCAPSGCPHHFRRTPGELWTLHPTAGSRSVLSFLNLLICVCWPRGSHTQRAEWQGESREGKADGDKLKSKKKGTGPGKAGKEAAARAPMGRRGQRRSAGGCSPSPWPPQDRALPATSPPLTPPQPCSVVGQLQLSSLVCIGVKICITHGTGGRESSTLVMPGITTPQPWPK